jgi:spore germination protein GerM
VTKKGVIIAVATAVALLVIVISFTFWLVKQTFPGEEDVEPNTNPIIAGAEPPAPEEEESAETEVVTEGRIQVTLYYLSGSGKSFTTEEREIPFSGSLQEQAEHVVQELLSGSRRGRGSPFPQGVQLRGLFITPQGLAFVDLSQELIANHPGGTCAEELTIYSLSNTLITNFPAVKGVQILVEGREVQSLAGHLDLSRPFGRGPQRLEPS